MLRRLRRLKLSLATKCQLLFGMAAGIIILAAVLVTWQRIEQLTRQQDVVSAHLLARQTLASHAAAGLLPPSRPPYEQVDGLTVRRPRLIGLPADGEPAPDLTPFEQKALNRFLRRPADADAVFAETYQTTQGRNGLLLAVPATLEASCITCHATGRAAGPMFPRTRPPLLPDSPLVEPPAALDDPTDPDSPGAAARLPSQPEADVRPALPLVLAPDLRREASRDVDDPEPPAVLLGLVSVDVPSQIRTAQLLLNRVFLVVASLFSALTAAVTLWFIATRLILQPVRVLQDTAERVRNGDLSVRSTIPSGDEFETLSETINEMLNVLQERNEQLRKANVSLDAKLDQLSATNIALDESNRLKSEFLANVSHELRTPLNSILGFADLLRQGDKADAKTVRYADNISRSGTALLELINELLDLAKIEAGRMEVRADRLSIKDLFEALVTLLKPLVLRKRLTIETSVGPQVPILTTDPGKLQQILYNLVSNAIKFSPEGAVIELSAGAEGGSVVVAVRDQGPGIDPADHGRIFEKFRQLDAGVTRQHAGSGLGLAISRDLARLLGGELVVDSESGRGATFRLTLPQTLPATDPPRDDRGEPRPRHGASPSDAAASARRA